MTPCGVEAFICLRRASIRRISRNPVGARRIDFMTQVGLRLSSTSRILTYSVFSSGCRWANEMDMGNTAFGRGAGGQAMDRSYFSAAGNQ